MRNSVFSHAKAPFVYSQDKFSGVTAYFRVGQTFMREKFAQHELYFLSGIEHVYKCGVPLDVTTSQFIYHRDSKQRDQVF